MKRSNDPLSVGEEIQGLTSQEQRRFQRWSNTLLRRRLRTAREAAETQEELPPGVDDAGCG